jgi:hypothetical protein
MGPLIGLCLRVIPPRKRCDLQKGQGTYKEALTNVKIAILKENYPEEKLTEDEQDLTLEELRRVFRGNPK